MLGCKKIYAHKLLLAGWSLSSKNQRFYWPRNTIVKKASHIIKYRMLVNRDAAQNRLFFQFLELRGKNPHETVSLYPIVQCYNKYIYHHCKYTFHALLLYVFCYVRHEHVWLLNNCYHIRYTLWGWLFKKHFSYRRIFNKGISITQE